MSQGQYLKLILANQPFLLPSPACYCTESRHRLLPPEQGHSGIVAWHHVQQQRWPVVALSTPDLPFTGTWSQVVFLNSQHHPVGLACEQLSEVADENALEVRPLGVIGSRIEGGPLISGLAMLEDSAIFILDAQRLLARLLQSVRRFQKRESS